MHLEFRMNLLKPRPQSTAGKAYPFVAGLAIVTIGVLEGYALSQGINGNALTASLAAIAGLGGASVGRLLR